MRLNVLLFAQLAETVGTDRITLDLPDDSTVADALESLSNEHPGIAELRHVLAAAINERYCNTARALNDGDTLALIPPVSGG